MKGGAVEFEIVQGEKGPQAANVGVSHAWGDLRKPGRWPMALSQELPAKGPQGTNQTKAGAPAIEADTLRRAALVQNALLFADISQTECREIVSRARERQFRRHRTIFHEGDPARKVILLTHGSIKITQLGLGHERF